MVGRIGGERGPLVVRSIISQLLEALYVPDLAILQDRGIRRCRQLAHNYRPSALERLEVFLLQGDPLYVVDVEHYHSVFSPAE